MNKRLISIAVSVAILLIIYSKIDIQHLLEVFQKSDPLWMTVSLGMVIPITLFTSWRLQQLMPKDTHLDFIEANRLILGASVLNMVLPSKMGDIAKAYFMKDRGHLSGSLALSLVIFEKACDMLSLLLWCVFGLFIYSPKDSFFWVMTLAVAAGLILGLLLLGSRQFAAVFFVNAIKIAPKKIKKKLSSAQTAWEEMHSYFWSDRQQLLKISLTSIFIWFLHLLQIWLFMVALRAWVPFWVNFALSPLAILAGLLPLTFAGVGTRDGALVFLYAISPSPPYFGEATAAALGLLCTSRYFLPAIIGLPFLSQMMGAAKKMRNQ
ncbi:lysylphosphatidylglycerol synthase transmembrane domain-containing protein [Gloeothece verrucosa]|nr:lysylphosphatidylglycerol synthase transmembrane domain-containing protein [Gloeothece verrucosa]